MNRNDGNLTGYDSWKTGEEPRREGPNVKHECLDCRWQGSGLAAAEHHRKDHHRIQIGSAVGGHLAVFSCCESKPHRTVEVREGRTRAVFSLDADGEVVNRFSSDGTATVVPQPTYTTFRDADGKRAFSIAGTPNMEEIVHWLTSERDENKACDACGVVPGARGCRCDEGGE